MIVAGLQMDVAWEDPTENFRRVERLVGEAMEGAERPRFLALPEMFATGFSMDAAKVAAFAEETREFLAGLASRRSVFILGGYAEPCQPRPANACSIFDPGGTEILHFQKLHPFSLAGEENHYVGGESLLTVEVEGVRVTPVICYDLRFPEPFRIAAPSTDLFCVIANWPEKRRDAWSTLLKARAIENQAWVLGVNRVGTGGGEPHSGDSVLLDPMGRPAGEFRPARADPAAAGQGTVPMREATAPDPSASGDPGQEGRVFGAVSPKVVARLRGRFTFLADRRPELYRRLEGEYREL